MNSFLNLIMGTNDIVSFAASLFFALVGVLLSLLLHTTSRDVNSPRTPIPFDWKFLVVDNARRIVLGILLVFVALRFSEEFIGAKLTLFLSLVIGLSFDNLAKILQNKILKP